MTFEYSAQLREVRERQEGREGGREEEMQEKIIA